MAPEQARGSAHAVGLTDWGLVERSTAFDAIREHPGYKALQK
jgi:hypothetical protein